MSIFKKNGGYNRHPKGVRAKRIDKNQSETANFIDEIGSIQDMTDQIQALATSVAGDCDHYYVAIIGTKSATECAYCGRTSDPKNEL